MGQIFRTKFRLQHRDCRSGLRHPPTVRKRASLMPCNRDTLGSISTTAYGTMDYQLLCNASVEARHIDPSTLPAGTILQIPCADGRLSAEGEIPEITKAKAPASPDADAAPETTTDQDAPV